MAGASPLDELEPGLRVCIAELVEEGSEIWDRFDMDVRIHGFHSFVPADYNELLRILLRLRQPKLRFLEWGSATGVIAIIADLLGYEAYGIEVDAELVDVARRLARRFNSNATFAAGSLLPAGYVYRPKGGGRAPTTLGQGESGYLELGHPLDDFELVYGYAWPGESDVMLDVMRCYGAPDARLLLNAADADLAMYRNGRRIPL
jgi:hypothetical protein